MSNDRVGLPLEGKVILVTGAASGIGRATALLSVRQGAAGVVIADRNATMLAETEREIEQLGGVAAVEVGSVTEPGAGDRLVARAVDRFGRLDGAVNNAGVRGELAQIVDCGDGAFDEVLDINLRAVFRCMRAQLRQMYAQGSGSIVNIASANVFGTSPELAPYAASKMGVIALSKVASKESGPHGVRVNVVAPGRTDTPLLGAHHGEIGGVTKRIEAIPLGRMGTPEELASVILFLCSDGAGFVNGAVHVVDGGRTG